MQIPMVFMVTLALLIGGVAHSSGNSDKNSQESAVAFSQLHENRTANNKDTSAQNSTKVSSLGKSTNSHYVGNSISSNVKNAVDYRLPNAETISARSIEANTAELRGEVTMYNYTKGTVFFVYGYNQKEVTNLTKTYKTFAAIPKSTSDSVRFLKVDQSAKEIKNYSKRVSGLVQDTDYFFKICVEFTSLSGGKSIDCGELKTFSTNLKDARSNKFSKPQVSVENAKEIGAYEATIAGNINMNNGEAGIAFLVYGEYEASIKNVDKIYTEYSDVEEDGSDLQKVRVATGLRGKNKFSEIIEDLDRGTKYFYRSCVEFDGQEDGLVCSGVRSFTTDSRDLSDTPKATTGDGVAYYQPAVKISGSINMRDYHDGIAFFVYGTDEVKVSALGGKGSFNRISQSIDKLQKISVDDDIDGSNSFSVLIKDLKVDSKYFYRMCVEFEVENDNNRDELYLSCGATKSFQSLR